MSSSREEAELEPLLFSTFMVADGRAGESNVNGKRWHQKIEDASVYWPASLIFIVVGTAFSPHTERGSRLLPTRPCLARSR